MVSDKGKFIGLGCLFCVEPGKKDEILVMFRKSDVKPGSKLKIQGCSVCAQREILVSLE